jgi:predicted Zn finger-like uncharacterized protein
VIICCEKCGTSYLVPDSAISEAGRIVKCAKCSHQWLAMREIKIQAEVHANLTTPSFSPPADFNNIKTEVDSNPLPKSSLPSVIDYKTPISLKLAPVILSIMIIFSLMFFYSENLMNKFSFIEQIYIKQNIFNTKDMVLDNLNFTKQQNDKNQLNIELTGKIFNNSEKISKAPLILITLRNKYNEKIISHKINPNQNIAPKQSFTLDRIITNLTADAEYISLDIGNNIDLFFVR